MKLFCSLLHLLLYLAVTGRHSHAHFWQLFYQDDDVNYHEILKDDPMLQLGALTNSIDAKWDKVSGATYYIISWTPEDNGGTHKVTDGSNTYTITGLLSCTNYNVTLQSWNGTNKVGQDLQASTSTLRNDPHQVSYINVTTVMHQSSQLAVSWPEAQGAGNCTITYKINWRPTGEKVIGENVTSLLNYTITDLEASTDYTVCVAAATEGYTGDTCNNGITDEEIPGVVCNISVIPLSESSLEVSWSPPDEPNDVITKYNISWTADNPAENDIVSNTTNYIITDSNITDFTITDLSPCVNYTVAVSAAAKAGFGEPSLQYCATNSTASDPPQMLTADKVTDQSDKLTVNWTTPEAPGPLCPVTNYIVTWNNTDTVVLVNWTTTDDTNFTISNLEAYTNYNVCVAAINPLYSEPSCTVSLTDQDEPGAPSNIMVDDRYARSLSVSWSCPDKPRGIITNYNVTWTATGIYVNEVSVEGNKTEYTIEELDPCTTYAITLQAATCKGYGDQEQINATTDAEPPAAPPSVSCMNVTSPRSVTVTWDKLNTKCEVRDYSVNYTGYVRWSDDVKTNTTETKVTYVDLTNLTPWTNYNVCVSAVIQNFTGVSNCCLATTPQAAPGRPARLQKTSSSAKSLTVSWEEPIELNGELTGYLLTWGDDSVSLPVNVTSYTISKLHRKTNYNITVQASTIAGCGEGAQIQEPTKKGVSAGAVMGGIVGSLLLLAGIVALVLVAKRLKGKGKAPELRGPIPDLPMTASRRTVHDGDVKKSNLRQYIEYLESDTQRGLEEEFARLQNDSPENFAVAAHREYNKDKNRFKNIFPFDNARVKLSVPDNKTGSDYINASYMLDTNNKAYFIAAQGPKSNTTADFWRMVWEQRVYVIIMLANLVEKGREKCFHYWPRSNESFINAGTFKIRNHTEEKRPLYTIRFLEVSEGSTKRLVKQYHFTGWPDFGAPQREEYLLDFISEIKNSMPTNGDHLLVHCSAGVGRTGTFIGLWNLIDNVDTDNTAQVINVKKIVLDMREYRPHMVQAADQYLYLFKCIAAYIEAPHLWNMDYAGADHIYDNTGYDKEEPIYDNTGYDNEEPIYENIN